MSEVELFRGLSVMGRLSVCCAWLYLFDYPASLLRFLRHASWVAHMYV